MANFSIQSVVDSKTIAMSSFSSSKANMRLAMRSDTGADGASFSVDALNKLKNSAKSTDGIKGTKVTGSIGDTAVEFNSANGKLSVGGTELKLGQGGFANALKDNISLEKSTNGGFIVNNLSNGTSATFDSSGNIAKKEEKTFFDSSGKELEGATDTTPGVDASRTKTKMIADIGTSTTPLTGNALLINNSNSTATAASSGGSNMVINRAAGATITGSAQGDKLFNLNATATAITGSGGNDSVYSVGLNSSANISLAGASGDMSYVKLLGNMKGGKVTMNGDTSLLDASGKTLNGVDVSAGGEATAVVASTLTGDNSKINLSGKQSAVDLRKLNQGAVTMGSGSNSVFIDSVTGNATSKAKITTSGEDTLRIKNMNNADLTQSSNKSSWMKLVSGMSNGTLTLGSNMNSIDASKVNFNKASITQSNGTGATAISAKSFMGDKTSKNSITLQGNGNTVSFSGTVQNANVQLGTGANTLAAGKINNAIINAGVGSTKSKEEQNITVKNGANKMTYTGSNGTDNLSFGGAVTDSSMDLGGGTNSVSVVNAKGKGQNLTNVNISSSTNGSSNTLIAGNIGVKGATGSSTINLGGSSTVSLGNVGASTTINLGTGANTMSLGAINGGKDSKKVTINMGVGGTNEQTLSMLRNTKNAAITFGAGNSTVSAGGSISNSTLNLGNATNKVIAKNAKGKDQALTNLIVNAGANSSTTITGKSLSSSGQASSSITLGGGTNNVSLSGSIGQNTTINFGAGSNTLDAGSINGTKNKKVNINVAQGSYNSNSTTTLNTRKGGANHLNYTGNQNADNLNFAGGVNNANLNLGAGENSLTASKKNKKGKDILQALNNVTVQGATVASGGVSSMTMKVGALKGKSSLTLGGSNDVTLDSVGAGVTIDLGLGSSSLTINKGITGGAAADKNVTIRFGKEGTTSSETQNVTIKGNVKGLNYVGSKGDDTLKILGTLSNSKIELGGGKNDMRVQDEKSNGKTITNTSIKSTGTNTTNSLTAGNVTSSGKGNSTVIDFSNGNADITLGNVSGNTQLSTGDDSTNASTVKVGKFSGAKVSYTSTGYGSFIAGEISKGATVDFSKSSKGSVVVGTDGTANGTTKPNGSISDASLKFGSNAVTLVVGGAEATGTTAGGGKNMSNVNIEGSNATSFTLRGTNVTGKSVLNLGGSVSVTLNGSLAGSSKLTTGTGKANITVKDIIGSSKDTRVTIDTSKSSSASMSVTNDATNFDFTGSAGSNSLTFNTINQSKNRTSFAANINVSNAAAGTVNTTTVNGAGRAINYTGSDNGTDHMKLKGDILNSTIKLGGGTNIVEGTSAKSAAGAMTNTNISDSSGANTTAYLSSLTNSGSGTGSLKLNGATANVSFASTGTVTSAVDMNAATSNVTVSGTVGKTSSNKTTDFNFGSNVKNGSISFGGNSTNLKIGGSTQGSVTASFTGGTHIKTDVTLAGGKGNTLNINATMNGIIANLGTDASGGATGANTVNVHSGAKFGTDKDAANITFKGAATLGNILNGTSGISNMNLTSTGADLLVDATTLKNFTAKIDNTKDATFTVTSAAETVTIEKANDTAGSGSLTFGDGADLNIKGLNINVGSSGALNVLAKNISDAKIATNGKITLGSNTDLKSMENVNLYTTNDVDVKATTFKNLTVSNAVNVTVGSTHGSGALTVTATGNVKASAAVKLGNVNMTVGGTTELGGATTTYESLSGTFTGEATILGKDITSGGDITLKASGSSLGISEKMNNVNVTNASAGKITVGVADTTEYSGGSLTNSSTGEMEFKGKSVTGTTVNGGSGIITGDLSGSFTGTYIEGSKAGNTLEMGGAFTGSADGTTLTNTFLSAADIKSKLTINGVNATASATNLHADVTINKGSLKVDNQNSGTITGNGDKSNTLIAVKTQDAGANINATGTRVQVGAGNGNITMSGNSELIINSVGSGGKVKLNDATSKIAFGSVTSGGNIDLNGTGNIVGFGAAGGDLPMAGNLITINGGQLTTTGTGATKKWTVDQGFTMTNLGTGTTVKESMPSGSATEALA